MNWYFYKIFLPLMALWTLMFAALLTGQVSLSWGIIFVVWFLIGPVGSGVGYHRLFSHRQFETWRPVEITLAVLGTLAAYAPLLFWVSNHNFHHKNSDDEVDSSSPKWYGAWNSFLMSRMRENTLNNVDIKNYCTRRILVDPKLKWLSRHFIKIIWVTVILLAVSGPFALVNFFLMPVLIEHIRVNLISCASHMKSIPGSYRNHATKDLSQNNIILGWLTMGFAWHNNHHHDERRLVLQERWWELDIEGLIGKLLSKPR